jgi:hypothetical protein
MVVRRGPNTHSQATYIPSSAVWRAMRGTGDDVREPGGETERLPPSDPRFIADD